MEAPNIICIAPVKIISFDGTELEGLTRTYAIGRKENPREVEYIRKDLLLDWAQKESEKVSIGLSEYDAGEENGKAEIIQKLIKKIKSL